MLFRHVGMNRDDLRVGLRRRLGVRLEPTFGFHATPAPRGIAADAGDTELARELEMGFDLIAVHHPHS